jgi:hypothetical protein
VTTYPVTSNSTTSATYPTPSPWGGVSTNIVSYNTNAICPNPPPPGLVIHTNWVNNSPTQPSPVPSGTTTNTIIVNNSPSLPSPVPTGTTTNTTPTTSDSYPGPSSYVGLVTTNWVGGSGKIRDYTYNLITGYTYPTYTYNYPVSFTYTWPNLTYSYFLYQTNTVVVTNHYDNVLYGDHNYVSSALTGSSIILGPNVSLVLPNGLTGAENLFFDYNSDNYEQGLTIWAGGTSATISGNQYINPSGFAGNLLVYCAPTVTSFTLNGNGQFTGVLVAPNADMKMNGGGNNPQDFCGSLMVNSVNLNGHFGFHWDEALRRLQSANARYLINSWNEIP